MVGDFYSNPRSAPFPALLMSKSSCCMNVYSDSLKVSDDVQRDDVFVRSSESGLIVVDVA